LADIRPTPGEVKPDAERGLLLTRLADALGGRLAVISGRGLADLDRVLEGRVTAVGAVHGLIRRTAAGELKTSGDNRNIAEAVSAFDRLASDDPGLLVENKDAAAAIHFRLAPGFGQACEALAQKLANDHGLLVQHGAMVVEVRAPGPDKGDAVTAFMREPPFLGSAPIFIGDDVTDENGFRAAEALGGFGVIVGPRRPTRARYGLPDVKSVQAWLGSMLEVTA